jgi:hypothetical protein
MWNWREINADLAVAVPYGYAFVDDGNGRIITVGPTIDKVVCAQADMMRMLAARPILSKFVPSTAVARAFPLDIAPSFPSELVHATKLADRVARLRVASDAHQALYKEQGLCGEIAAAVC